MGSLQLSAAARFMPAFKVFFFFFFLFIFPFRDSLSLSLVHTYTHAVLIYSWLTGYGGKSIKTSLYHLVSSRYFLLFLVVFLSIEKTSGIIAWLCVCMPLATQKKKTHPIQYIKIDIVYIK